MNSIAEIFSDSNRLFSSISNFFDRYIGTPLLRKCGIKKLVDDIKSSNEGEYCDNPILRLIGKKDSSRVLERIVRAKDLLVDKLMLCYHPESAHRMFKAGTFFKNYKKDTFYRFDRMSSANWERLQLETARNVILDIENRTKKDHVNVLIFDDSLYMRTSGKGTELCARVFDHNDRKTRLGFRMMTGVWSNSETTVPFAQALLSTRDEKQMIGTDDQSIDRRTLRWKRRNLAKTKGTEVMRQMVNTARQGGIPFDYVLFDTWFSSPAQLIDLKKMDVRVIAMIKKNSTKYIWTDPDTNEAKKLDVKEIYSRNKKRRGRSKYLLSVPITINSNDGSIPAKLVYARNRNNRKDWVCFICTEPELDEETIIRTYTIRWNIELYFKVCKSYLKLRTECHSTSYDALTSHMVVVAIRYMVLAIERFNGTDDRTIEDIFYQIQRDIVNEMMTCNIVIALDALLDSVRICFGTSEEKIGELVRIFIEKLPVQWKMRFMRQSES